MRVKFAVLHLLSLLAGVITYYLGLTPKQAFIVSIFAFSILGSLFFWDFRLSFAFIGSGLFLIIRAVNLEDFIRYASLDVILFLISMMIIVGMMKEAGFFGWLLTILLRVGNLNGRKLFVILMASSAVFSAMMGEVASIILIMAIILDLSNFLEIDPVPLVISAVLATNIGSAATVLGNPVGVLIAARSKLSFEDFLVHALPVSVIVLAVTIFILCVWYRKYIREISSKLKGYVEDKSFLYLISVPPDRPTEVSMGVFGITIVLIALHKRLEILLGLEHNTLLIMLPVISAGIVMLYRHEKARYYVEHEVEWNSLLFFLFLFAQAGVIQASGVAAALAKNFVAVAGDHPGVLAGSLLFLSGLLSSVLDNVVAVTVYIPIMRGLDMLDFNLAPLWWALLFGACYGGNITMIGSTANIVALGVLEKERNIEMRFRDWLKIGLVIGLLSMAIAFGMLIIPMGS